MMRRVAYVLMGLACVSVVLPLASCGKDEEYVCETEGTACGTFSACCTSEDCYYLYNGTKYPCNGTDCQAAAQTLVGVMCGSPYADGTATGTREALEKTTRDLAARAQKAPCAVCP